MRAASVAARPLRGVRHSPPAVAADEAAAGDGALALGVARFVAATGRDRYWRLQARIDRTIVSPRTGMLKPELVRRRRCAVCGADAFLPAFVARGVRYGRCRRCGFLYANPVLRAGALREIGRRFRREHEELFGSGAFYGSPVQRRFDAVKFARGLDRLEQVVRPGRLLDVGTGSGHFVECALARGWQAEGIESEPLFAKEAARRGLPVRRTTLSGAGVAPGSLAALTLWDVLSELPRPRRLLAAAAKLLREGGAILVYTPNGESLALRVMHGASAAFGYRALNFFTPATLRSILASAGLELVHIETMISELETVNNWLSFQPPYEGSSSKPVLDFLSPHYLHERLLGYRLLAIARKAGGPRLRRLAAVGTGPAGREERGAMH